MNAMNSFSITGFVCKDAEVKNFDKASVARFGIFVKHTEKKNGQEVTTTAIQGIETWVKNDDKKTLDLLKKGSKIAVEGFFKAESYTDKDGKTHNIVKLAATKVEPAPKKEDDKSNGKKKK